MKKFLSLALIFSAIISTTTYAQPSGDQAAIAKPVKEEKKPSMEEVKQMMGEKTGLTAEQVDKVMAVNMEIRQMASKELEGLTGEERTNKLGEYKALKGKKYSEIPLTRDQIKAVYTFYEDMGKNRGGK